MAAQIPIVHCIPALHTLHTCKHASDSTDITPQVCIVTIVTCRHVNVHVGNRRKYAVLSVNILQL